VHRLSILVVLSGCGRLGFDSAGGAPPDPDAPNVTTITIQHNGGDGTVVGPNGFTCTGQTCTLDVAPGTVVSFRGLAATDSWFAGWTGPCGGNFDCEFQADTSVTILADFSPTPNRVFVTSTTTDGAFGGLAGGDAICAARAAAAGLNGTFIAYLSDSTTNAANRVNAGSRGWVRTDGAPFADAPTVFATGNNLVFPVRLDEYGNDLGDVRVYTGTNFGSTTANLCLDWTSNAGVDTGTVSEPKYGFDSAGGYGGACSSQAHLLCAEIGRVVQIKLRPDTGRVAFMTKTNWIPGGGRASADALCTSEAAAAGLTGTFLAAIATTTESIASRFPIGEVYRRVDGVRLLRSPGMLAADWLDVPPQLDQLGDVVRSDFWSGASRLSAASASPADNCNDWMDGTGTINGIMHWTTNTDLRSPAKADPCDNAIPVLCLEH